MASGAIAILVCSIIYAVIGGGLLFYLHKTNPQEKGLVFLLRFLIAQFVDDNDNYGVLLSLDVLGVRVHVSAEPTDWP